MKKYTFSFLRNVYSGSIRCYSVLFAITFTAITALSAQTAVCEIALSKNWQLRDATANKWMKAVVPGCVHSDLFRNKMIPDPYYRTNEKDLQWIDKKDWEYKTIFDASSALLKNDSIDFVFKGLDTFADVFLNNRKILSADNMFREWVVDVKPYLLKGQNELRVYFHSPIKKGLELLKENGFSLPADNDQSINGGLKKEEQISPFIRKAPYHFGWDWGPRFVTSGIWRSAFIRAWSGVKMVDFYVKQQSLTDQLATLNAEVEVQSTKKQSAVVEILDEGKVLAKLNISLEVGANRIDLPFKISKPKRWWTNGLGEAHLYSLTATVCVGKIVDRQSRQIGLRTLKLIQKPDSAGHSFYFELNGVPVFAKGANHIPNDMFLDRVTPQVYDWEIATAVKSNMNMLRVWGGGIYEDDYFYELCDRNGILIWQDFMFACSLYPGNESFLNSITQEANYQVKRLRNHPSIALWCGNNEIDIALQHYNKVGGWGWKERYAATQNKELWSVYDTIFNRILPRAVHLSTLDMPYWQSSPATVIPQAHSTDTNKNGDVHYWGVWWGKHPFEKYADNIGRFMSEYGFQSFPELETVKKYALPEDYDIESEVMRHHQRSSIGNVTIQEYMNLYYRKPLDFSKFLYVGQALQAYGIRFAVESHRRAMPFNMGSLVWQINDCWPVASWSSCDYFHRWKALQYELKRSFEPILISAYAQGENTSITVVSDKLQEVAAQLELNVCDFTGKILQSRTLPLVVKANGSTSVLTQPTALFTNRPEGCYLTLSLKLKGVSLAEKIYYFTVPKNLQLLQPKIVSSVEKQKDAWVVRLKSDVLVKDLYLNFPGTAGFFNNNYFDLLPGKELKISFKPTDKNAVPSKLELMSLVDTY